MITDDDLTTELTRALRDGTDHLTYTGRVPRAHRPLAVTVAPVAATAAAATVLGWTALTSGGTPSGSAPEAAPTSTSPTSAPAQAEPEVVTDQIELAGLTFTYTRGADDPAVGELLWSIRDRVPAGATEFDVDGTTVWAAEDPDTGFAGLFLRADDDQVVALLSESRTLEEMRELAGTLQLA